MKFLITRLLRAIIGLALLITALYFVLRIVTGDPLLAIYGERLNNLTELSKEQLRQTLGFDTTLIGGYIDYIKELCRFNLGRSYTYQQDVSSLIVPALKNTLVLMLSAYSIIFALAIPTGIYLASVRGKTIYCNLRKMGLLLHSMPEFWTAMILIMVFSVSLGLTPVSGMYELGKDTLFSRIHHMILPVTVIVISHLGFYYNFVSDKFTEEMKKIYVLGVKAKGLGQFKIWYIHMLKNVMSSLLALASVSFVHIVGGSYVVEYIFNYKGMGTLLFESAKNGDYPLLIGATIVTATMIMIFGIIIDYLTMKIDKRIEV